MRIGAYYSHLNGFEWLKYHHPEIWDELVSVIESVDAESFRTKVSQEQGMIGKLLYSPVALNNAFKGHFRERGWKESRTGYWVTSDHELTRKIVALSESEQRAEIIESGRTPIRSYNQTDFLKNRVAVEVQLAKYSFIPYDVFVKHMAFFVGDKIDLGIEIVPMKSMQANMSSGPGYYEGALFDIARQGRGIPAVPLIVIGVEP